MSVRREFINKGVSFGSVLAIVISYVAWKSVFWAIFHGILGWIYVIYYLLVHKHEILKITVETVWLH
ncbi:hypothetical protein [Haloplasma contractile]|uniref:Uncharacterized protein n=1 Tax=Haloplasma contractile SSD-17B TaxID=1033810 RepID=U2DZZ5_9MOLU|nr:hypothetical protein [Haloplasma contractile]ERJ13757.1 hypothetical protein HLPCO_000423 [Haloplasma contractile SSD-17B]